MTKNDRLVAGIILTVIGVLGLSSGGMGYAGMGGMMGGYGMMGYPGFGFFPLLLSAVFLGITLFGVYLIYEAVK
ncbi:hypothetical protein [Candidatus Pyrohabitans sp.]